jgi:hypothetical protein
LVHPNQLHRKAILKRQSEINSEFFTQSTSSKWENKSLTLSRIVKSIKRCSEDRGQALNND